MEELNESQLLLLNSLVYLDADFAPGFTVGEIVQNIDLDQIDYGGGLTREEAEELIQAIQNDPELASLEVSHYTDGEIRAACFVNPETNEAVIAYRGTGPLYEAWDDNCQGGYLSDTDMQKQALAFAQECAQDYDNITVTGHSKGGNMAQYVTVLMGDKVDRCVSFDGQGFSDEFLTKYADEIEANRSKIRSVCSYNDYVNILLTPIAAEIVYLDTEESMFPGGHYPFDLYKNQNNKLDENGEYVTSRKQDPFLSGVKVVLNTLLGRLDDYGLKNPIAEFLFYSAMGMIMGGLMGENVSLDKIVEEFLENLVDFAEYYIQQWISGKQDTSVHVAVNTDALRESSGTLSSAAREIASMRGRIKAIQQRMSSNIIAGAAVGLPLQTVLMRLDSECMKLRRLAAALDNSADQYDSAESRAESEAT